MLAYRIFKLFYVTALRQFNKKGLLILTHYIIINIHIGTQFYAKVYLKKKNPAYGRQRICQPMGIKAPIFFELEKNLIINPERLLVLRAL